MRFQTIQTSFTAGEISPRLYGRVDIARYNSGVKTMLNAYPLPHGGATRWPGSQYIAAAKNANKKARLIPFVFSATQAYILEFGDLYIRFYTAKAQISGPLELASPYAEADLPNIRFTQASDTMFLTCPGYYPRRLQRFSNTVWKLTTAPFSVEPHEEVGVTPTTTLTLGAVSGTGISATAGSACFQNADVGRYLQSGAGYAKIVGFTSTTQVTVDITDAFSAVGIASGAWTITGSPQTSCTPSVASPVGASVNLTLGANGWNNVAATSDIGRYVRLNGGLVEITGYTSATVVSGVIRSVLASASAAAAGGWSLESKSWNATNGYPTACTLHEQRLILAGTTAFPNTTWGSKTGDYLNFADGIGDSEGWAFDAFSEQQNVIMHVVSMRNLLPFGYGGEWSMKGGLEKPITPTNVQIRNESSYGCGALRPIKVGGEVMFFQRDARKTRMMSYQAAGDNYPSSDVSIISEHITEGGITDICYAQAPDALVAMVRADGVLVSCTINREQDVIGWARRTTDGVFESVASIPYGSIDQIWAVVRRTVNGSTVRYVELLEPQADHTTNRQTDCSITGTLSTFTPSALSWAGGVVTFTTSSAHGIAVGGYFRLSGMTPSVLNGDWQAQAGTGGTTIKFNLESDPGAVTTYGTFSQLSTTWAGLSHLEAKSVDVVAEGVVFPSVTVSGGSITLPRAVFNVEIGLHYETDIEMLPPEVQTPNGTSQGNQTAVNQVYVRLNRTAGCEINGQVVPFRKFGDAVLNQTTPLFTGIKDVRDLGWSREEQVRIKQTQPLPFQVLAVIRKVTITD